MTGVQTCALPIFTSARYEGQPVRRGQELFRIHSPELNEAQRNFLQNPTASARQRLERLGLSSDQLNNLERTREIISLITLVSPADGILSFETGDALSMNRSSAGKPGEMSGNQTAIQKSVRSTLSPGMQVTAGQVLVSVRTSGLSNIRVTIQIGRAHV